MPISPFYSSCLNCENTTVIPIRGVLRRKKVLQNFTSHIKIIFHIIFQLLFLFKYFFFWSSLCILHSIPLLPFPLTRVFSILPLLSPAYHESCIYIVMLTATLSLKNISAVYWNAYITGHERCNSKYLYMPCSPPFFFLRTFVQKK